MTVPEDRAKPQGRKLRLKLQVIPRASKGEPDAPLFLLQGGPGGAATTLAEFAADKLGLVHAMRDIVLLDQRGTGGSNPLNCPVREGSVFLPKDPAACLQHLSGHADPRLYTTPVFAQDLDDLRAALGYQQISLYGVSYGTRAAQVYLRQFPEHVKSLVLVSAIPLSAVLPDSLDPPAKRAVDLLVADCASDPLCHAAFPNFASEISSARAGLAPEQVIGLHFLLYSSTTARRVPWLVHQAFTGHSQPLDREIAQNRKTVTDALSIGLHLTVVCSEDVPFSKHPQPSDPFGAALDKEYAGACQGWPIAAMPENYRSPLKSEIPVLIIAGDRDPVTPPENARDIARDFPNANLVIVPGSSHFVDGFDGCLTRVISRFLNDRPIETACVDSLRPPKFFIGQ